MTTRKKRIFSRKDYHSGDGMLTTVFGPPMWHFLHTMSFNYPIDPTPQEKRNYKTFLYQLRHILPCKYCRINLTKNLKRKPILACHLLNRDTFSRYVYDLHELVNQMLHKTSHLTYCDVRERYEHFRSRCTDEKPKIFHFIRKYPSSASKTKTRKITNRGKGKGKEQGCTEPLYGKKSKCVLQIVPQEDKKATFQINEKCLKTRE